MPDGKVTIAGKQMALGCFARLVEAVEALVNEKIESLGGNVRIKRANAHGIEVGLGQG